MIIKRLIEIKKIYIISILVVYKELKSIDFMVFIVSVEEAAKAGKF